MKVLQLLFITIVLIIPVQDLFAQEKFDTSDMKVLELTDEAFERICSLNPTNIDLHKYFPRETHQRNKGTAQQTADIDVTYVTGDGAVGGWPVAARQAFEYAMDIWESHISSSVPIRIQAVWNSDLSQNVLGSARPNAYWSFTDGDTFYPQPLASALSGEDLVATNDDVEFDILVNMSANFPDWYFGTDAQTPEGEIDFVTVAIHEIGHGLGFAGTMRESSGGGTAQWGLGTPPLPSIYDRFVIDGGGNEVVDQDIYANNSVELYGVVRGQRGGILFAGFQTIAGYNGRAVPLHAPNVWNQGSSYSHVDLNTFTGTENALMRPQIDRAFAVHSPGPIVCTMFGDMGWPLGEDCTGFEILPAELVIDEVPEEGVNFGVTNENESIRQDITISNSAGAEGFMIARLGVTGGDIFRISNKFVTLDPGESRNIPIIFRPNSAGELSGELSITYNGPDGESTETISLKGEALEEGETYVLDQNYPNPFNATTNIPYAISQTANVRIDVYDALGKHVQTLVNEEQNPGRYILPFRANDLSSGMFMYRIVVDGESEIKKLLYAK